MREDVLEAMMPYLVERLGRVYERNKDYRQAIEREDKIYEKLKQGLTQDQKSQLDEYFVATKATAGVCEKLSYQQGIRDLFSFCISMISKREDGE